MFLVCAAATGDFIIFKPKKMQHTLSTGATGTTTPKTVIDELFDCVEAESISSELLESYLLFTAQFDTSDPGTMRMNKRKFTILTRVINFVNELEKYSGFSSDKATKDYLIFPKQGDKTLQDLIETFYLNNDAKAVTFEIWDTYVSAVGNDSTKAWSVSKHSNIAFTMLHLNTCLLNLEFFKKSAICLT